MFTCLKQNKTSQLYNNNNNNKTEYMYGFVTKIEVQVVKQITKQ